MSSSLSDKCSRMLGEASILSNQPAEKSKSDSCKSSFVHFKPASSLSKKSFSNHKSKNSALKNYSDEIKDLQHFLKNFEEIKRRVTNESIDSEKI